MKIAEIDVIRIDEKGNQYNQEVFEEMKVSQNTNWDDIKGEELNEDYVQDLRSGKRTLWD